VKEIGELRKQPGSLTKYTWVEKHFDALHKWAPIATTIGIAIVGLVLMNYHGSFSRLADLITNWQTYYETYPNAFLQFGFFYMLGMQKLDLLHVFTNLFSFVLVLWSPVGGSIIKENILEQIKFQRYVLKNTSSK